MQNFTLGTLNLWISACFTLVTQRELIGINISMRIIVIVMIHMIVLVGFFGFVHNIAVGINKSIRALDLSIIVDFSRIAIGAARLRIL